MPEIHYYFDYNATTPLDLVAKEVLINALEQDWQNPAAAHLVGRRLKEKLEEARAQLGDFVGCEANQIIFNSGATEGNNTLMEALSKVFPSIAVSAVEHGSVKAAAKKHFGSGCYIIPVDEDGVVDLDVIESWLREKKISAVSVMAANNEVGVLQPWESVCNLCHQYGALYHCDASQWFGKLPAHKIFRDCDFITGCAHKFYGPKGVGFIKINKAMLSYEAFVGGGQENGARAGTVNYPSIASMLAVLLAKEETVTPRLINAQLMAREAFEKAIKEVVPDIKIIAETVDRLWNTVGLVMPACESFRWTQALERKGFLISSGAACAVGQSFQSPTLLAIGFDDEAAARGLRVSGGFETSSDSWLALAKAFGEVWEDFQCEENASSLTTVVEI